jgi:hypothetical protein
MLLACVGVCGAAIAVIVTIHSSGNPVDSATVLSGDLAAAALAVTLLMALGAWWQKGRVPAVNTPSQVAAAADRLAADMADRWQLEAARRRISVPTPVSVRWRWSEDMASRTDVTALPVPGAGVPPLPGPGSSRGEVLGSGMVTRLHDELYARLPHGRLILLGGPGAGKTGAMILLLLAALRWRESLADGDERARVPVPVWLTLGNWDPATITLHEWAAARMRLDHPALRALAYGTNIARELLRTGKVALFLDGLDEMPRGTRAHALRRVSEEAARLRVVLTSRPEEYQHAAEEFVSGSTAVVELLPVRPAEAGRYLLYGQAGPRRRQWSQVAGYLVGNPASAAALTLDNPLTLSLAREAYAGKDPAELTDPAIFPSQAVLREHLIDHVLVTAYPDEKQRAHVAMWLAWIARHMGTSRDLPWWDIPAWVPPWQLRLARVLGFGLLVGLGSALALDVTPALTAWMGSHSMLAVITGVTEGLATGLVFGILFGPWLGRAGTPRAVTLRWPARRHLARLVIILLMLVLMTGLVSSMPSGNATFWLSIGLGIIGAAWLAFEVRAIWGTPVAQAPSATAAGTYRSDRITSVVTGLAVGITFGYITGLTSQTAADGVMSALGDKLDAALPVGFTIALAAGLLTGQVPRLKLAETTLGFRHRNRVRFIRLLEDASHRQVLRQAGVVYQFRHAALQDHLANSDLSVRHRYR